VSLFVRTSSGGTGPDVPLNDLGIIITTSILWTELTYYNSMDFGNGQFTPETLATSEHLYDSIKNGNLEASSDGISHNIVASEYVPSYPISQAIIDGYRGIDLSDSRFVLPIVSNPSGLTNPLPRLGELLYNSTDGYVEFYDGAFWQKIGASAGAGGGGATNLDGLTDVNLPTTPPFVGALLGFDGYEWVPVQGRTMYNKEIDELSDGTLYIGEALPGTLQSAASWRIQKIVFTSIANTEDVSKTWANGNALFDKIWNNRLAYSYS